MFYICSVSTAGSALEHIKRTHEAVNENESKHISAAVSLISNASNSNEQHDMEINFARVTAEEDVAKNSNDLFEQFVALADSSRLNLLPFRSCSEDKTFRDKDDKVDELLTSPTPKASAKALPSMSKLGLKRINPEQNVDFDTNLITLSYFGVFSRQSPFRTPPSLSHCPDKVHPINDIQCTGPSDQLYLRQHKKVF